MSSYEIIKEEIVKELTEYFKVLVQDGLLEPYSVTPTDVEAIADRIVTEVVNKEMELEAHKEIEASE
jgi:hypothetical protein